MIFSFFITLSILDIFDVSFWFYSLRHGKLSMNFRQLRYEPISPEDEELYAELIKEHLRRAMDPEGWTA
jgi:hypothetical protein